VLVLLAACMCITKQLVPVPQLHGVLLLI
jgi:hypothetical protein